MSTVHGPLLLVADRRAAHGRGGALAELRALLDAAGVEHAVAVIGRRGDGAELTRRGVADGARFVVAVGGDGTVNAVVNGLVDADTGAAVAADLVVGAVPTDGANDFLRTYGLDVPLPRLLRDHLLAPATMPLDLGRARFRTRAGDEATQLFANMAQAGFGADVLAVANRLPRRAGAVRQLAGIAVNGVRLSAVDTTLTVDHTSTTEPVTEIVIANGQFLGGGMKLAPRALPDDGRFNVQSWRGGIRDILGMLPVARHGEHLQDALVREWQSTTVGIDGGRLTLELDGDVVGSTPAAFDLLPGVLRISV
jgi:YegS/Rv2252/BmrU family lipid kinase